MARICFILEVFPQLSETFILDQIASLHSRGHDIQVVADYFIDPDLQNVTSPLIHDLQKDGMQRWARDGFAKSLLRIIPGRIWTSARRIFDSLSDHKLREFDLIIAHFGNNGLRIAKSRFLGLFDTPFICIFHGSDIGVPAQRGTLAEYRPIFEQASELLTVNAYFRDLLIASGCPTDRVHVHHMGVSLPEKVPHLPLDSVQMRLISVCRLVEKKGLTYAIESVAALKSLRPEILVKYEIIGDGPQMCSLREQVVKSGLTEEVHFLGALHHEGVKKKIAEASIFLLPSVTAENGDVEGIPVALMEAMAAGRIVISTRHSGIPELIDDGVSGLLVEERRSLDLAKKIAWVFDNPSFAARLGREGRQKVDRCFNKERLDQDFADMVEDLCQISGRS